METIRVISLWRPWANWVALGWKTIESRKHRRFQSLAGQRIGIHAGLYWDNDWLKDAREFLTPNQIALTMRFLNIGGAIICTAQVTEHRPLTASDSAQALIDCASVERHGLILQDLQSIEAIPMKGRQGIWKVPASAFIPSTRSR